MKSTGTKRILSVLSAGALVASMSAVTVFAAAGAKAQVTEINLTNLENKKVYVNTGAKYDFTGNPAIYPTGGTVKMKVDKTTENTFDEPASMNITSIPAADWKITQGDTDATSSAAALAAGTYTVTLDKASAKIVGSMDNTAITYDSDNTTNPTGDSGKVTVSVPSSFTMPSFTLTVTEKETVTLPEAGKTEVSIKAMTGTEAKTAIAALDIGVAGLATFQVDNISENPDGAASPVTGTLDTAKTYYAGCTAKTAEDGYDLPTPATFILKVKVTPAGTIASTKSADYVLNGETKFSAINTYISDQVAAIEGVGSVTTVAYEESKIAGVTVAAPDASSANKDDVMKANDRVVAKVTIAAKPGYAAPTGGKITYTLNIKGQGSSSSDDDDEDTGSSSSDAAPDFSKDEMDSSTAAGNEFNHPKTDVLQSKLNSNKGTTISIGEVKSGTKPVATFAVTLPKNSGNVSENKVAQVINVLNTISTKSASKNAQSVVDDMLKSADTKNTASMPISFSKSMSDFGMTVSVTVPVTSKFTNGGTSLYYYNSSTKKLEAQKTTVAIRGGKATFDLTHASEYFLIQGVKDLSAGEGATDSEDTLSSNETTVTTSQAPVVTAPEVTEPAPVESSAPSVATNPGTGNAPIALAVIPVAVAAAAIIAKKAK